MADVRGNNTCAREYVVVRILCRVLTLSRGAQSIPALTMKLISRRASLLTERDDDEI